MYNRENLNWQNKTWEDKEKSSRTIRRENERKFKKFAEKLSGMNRMVYEKLEHNDKMDVYKTFYRNSRWTQYTENDTMRDFINNNKENLTKILRLCKIEMI